MTTAKQMLCSIRTKREAKIPATYCHRGCIPDVNRRYYWACTTSFI